MKRFLFLAFLMFTLVAFTANAPPCDMGKQTLIECNLDVGQPDNTIAGVASCTFDYSAVGLTTPAELSMEMIQIYPIQPASTETVMVDQRAKCRDVDCAQYALLISTSNHSPYAVEMPQNNYTQLGYSLWE